MTSQLQHAIATIKTLSNSEQRQLLQILSETVNKSSNLEQQNQPCLREILELTNTHP